MYQKLILKNNLRLIIAPLKETQTATLLVLIRAGSRYESGQIGGASHFIEHLFFKGTKKRSNTLAIAKELDGVGAEFNAFTAKDATGYYIKADSRHLHLAIDVLADMLLNSKFEEKEIKKEKGVIIEEINMYEDNPLMYVENMLEQIMFRGNSLGRLISGSRKTVKAISREQLLAYKDKLYQSSNAVIGLAGRFQDQDIKMIERQFKFKAAKNKNQFQPIKISQKNPRVELRFKETEQTQIALGLPAYSYFHPGIYALEVLNIILGGNMSSRLFLKVRERAGLAYFIRSGLNIYEDIGGLIIQAGLDKIRIEKAINLILAELAKIRQGVSQAELKRAKEYLAGRIALNLEDSANLAQWYVQQELLLNKILTPEAKIKKIMAVSLAEIKQVAQAVINFKKINLAVIGPFKEEKKFAHLLLKNI